MQQCLLQFGYGVDWTQHDNPQYALHANAMQLVYLRAPFCCRAAKGSQSASMSFTRCQSQAFLVSAGPVSHIFHQMVLHFAKPAERAQIDHVRQPCLHSEALQLVHSPSGCQVGSASQQWLPLQHAACDQKLGCIHVYTLRGLSLRISWLSSQLQCQRCSPSNVNDILLLVCSDKQSCCCRNYGQAGARYRLCRAQTPQAYCL